MNQLASIDSREAWDDFQAAQPYAQFLQSWAWGEFRRSLGEKVERYALTDEKGNWLVAVQMEFRERRFGMGYWFASRGPVFASNVKDDQRRVVMMELCEQLLKEKKLRTKTLFWRMEPLSELAQPEGLVPLTFRRVPPLNPSVAAILDLTPGEDELFKSFHEKTRYNARLAERHGVTVRVAKSDADVERFLDLLEETATRDEFVQHPRAYLKKTYEFLHKEQMARIRLAEYKGKILSANLEISFGDTVTYLHGSSSNEDRQVKAPFALHWQAIKDAKLRGFTKYDFGGCNPISKAMFSYKASWEGITRFKFGWGAKPFHLVGTWDLPFNVVLYRLAFLKQFFRG